jgi:hypothetical protein
MTEVLQSLKLSLTLAPAGVYSRLAAPGSQEMAWKTPFPISARSPTRSSRM